jgi:flagellin
MSLIANTNVSSLIAQRNLSVNTTRLSESLKRLSTGYKINRSADDVAGNQISKILTSQIAANQKALQNAQDGISALQVAEGGISVITENLQRIRELTVQAASDVYDQSQRNAIMKEVVALAEDIDRIGSASSFNGIQLLDGTTTNAILQIGGNDAIATNTLDVTSGFADVRTGATGVIGGTASGGFITTLSDLFDSVTQASQINTAARARAFLTDLDTAIQQTTQQAATIGAFQNRLESVSENLQNTIFNFSTSNSRIRDLDVAQESADLAQFQVLQQASISVLAQANSIPQSILKLLDR